MYKIALTGGGTAGHVTPNIALIPELKKRNFDIIYIGMKDGVEKEICERHSIIFYGVTCDKLRRYLDIKNLKMPINVIKGIIEAKQILKREKVDIIFSKGGFVGLPVVIAAKSLGIPVVSHESDLTLGLANKLSVPFANVICTNFEETAKTIKNNKGIYTGCPIRNELFNGNAEKGKNFLGFKNDKPILFVIGGSLGSVKVNNIIRENLDEILKTFNVAHGCGKGKMDPSIKNIDGYKQYELIKDELADVYAAADVVVSRAGANVIFELMALNKVNLLIPLGLNASRGDQILNAKLFKKKQWSEIMLEDEYDKDKTLFIKRLNTLWENKDKYLENLKRANLGNVCEQIAEIIVNNIKKSTF